MYVKIINNSWVTFKSKDEYDIRPAVSYFNLSRIEFFWYILKNVRYERYADINHDENSNR